MLKKSRYFVALPVIFLLLGTMTGVPACRFLQVPAGKNFSYENSRLNCDPALVTGTLDNGVGYVLMENSRPENRVSMHLVVEAGSIHETERQRGLAHYLEHMMFNGTTHFSPGELVKYFQSIGMRFGNDANAHTGFLRTVYDLHLPTGEAKSLRQGLVVMGDYAEAALLLESEVNKERGVILSEKRTRDSVAYRTFKAELNFELAGSRLTRRYPIGIEEVIKDTGSDRLRNFYDTWYRPENLTLVVVGDFEADTAKKLIKEEFAFLSARAPAAPEPDWGQVSHSGTRALYHYEKEAGSTDVTLETLKQTPQPADSAALRKKRFVRDMAYRIVNYRLAEILEGSSPPFTSASARAGQFFQKYRYATITASCAPENWEKALRGVEKTLRKALLYGFTQAEVERVKKEVLAELDRAVKQQATRESGQLARQIMHTLANRRVLLSPEQRRRLFSPVAESLTPAALHEALQASWQPSARLILVTGNADLTTVQGAAPEKHILTVYRDSRERSLQPPEEKALPDFPYLPEPAEKGEIKREDTAEDLGITRIDFANGVRLNFKKTDFKDNQVRMEIGFGQGESAEPADKPALCELGAAVVNESGFSRMKKEELKQALAGEKAGFSFSVDQNRCYLRGSGASDEVTLLFQLFYTFYKDFGCRREARQRVLDRYRQQYDKYKHTPSGAMRLSGFRFLAGGDSRFGLPPDLSAFQQISVADITDWLNRSLKKRPPEISVVGDFEKDEVVRAARRYFGGLQMGGGATPETASERRGPSFPAGDSLNMRIPSRIPKALVHIAWPTDDYWDVHRTRRLFVLADVFSDRMRRTIREKFGQSYSQYAYSRPSRAYAGYGVFHAAAKVAPAETGTVVSYMKEIAADIVHNGVTGEELQRATDPIITHIKEMVKTNGYWLDSVLSGCRAHPEKVDWARGLLEDYQSMTVSGVTETARRYLDNDKSANVIIRPEQDDPVAAES